MNTESVSRLTAAKTQKETNSSAYQGFARTNSSLGLSQGSSSRKPPPNSRPPPLLISRPRVTWLLRARGAAWNRIRTLLRPNRDR